MRQPNSAGQPFVAAFARLAAQRNGANQDRFKALRSSALACFRDLGLPSTKHEDWRYTNLRHMAEIEFQPAETNAATTTVDSALLDLGVSSDGAIHKLVFVNGRFSAETSSLDRLPAGLTVQPLATASDDALDAAAKHLGHVAPFGERPFTALNTALFDDGAFICVAPNATIDAPLYVLFVSTAGDTATASQARVLISAGANSRAVVAEVHVGGVGPYLNNAVTEVVLDDGANVELVKLQNEGAASHHIAETSVLQKRDSRFDYTALMLGGGLSRNALIVRLDGPGASCKLNGLSLGRGDQHIDSPTVIDHAVPHCSSDHLHKTILDDRASAVFNGKVVVRQGAIKTDARQSNHNLLLAKSATANTRPQLEIYADDVKCAHGATVGKIDEQALFYLRSRGIDVESARSMLTFSFAIEVLDRIEHAELRDLLYRATRAWMGADAGMAVAS